MRDIVLYLTMDQKQYKKKIESNREKRFQIDWTQYSKLSKNTEILTDQN